jgi:hypothetical protein
MALEDRLPKDTRFTSENQPKNKGRKKGTKNKKTILKEYLEEAVEIKMKDGSIKKGVAIDLLIAAAIEKGIADKDMSAIKELFDRFYGKVTDKLQADINGEIDNNINIRVVRPKKDK